VGKYIGAASLSIRCHFFHLSSLLSDTSTVRIPLGDPRNSVALVRVPGLALLAGPDRFSLDLYPPTTTTTKMPRERSNSVTTTRTYAGLMGRPLGLLISTIATTGFLLFGYDQGVMSGIISADPFNNYFPETKGNSVYQGFVTAIYEIGCLIGAIFILWFGDSTGRRRAVRSTHPLWKSPSKQYMLTNSRSFLEES
jgi:hypothetical protein